MHRKFPYPASWCLILLVLLLGCQPSTPIEHQVETPQVEADVQVAVQWINDYVTYCNTTDALPNPVAWVENRTDVSADFKKALKYIMTEAEAEYPEIGLGFDPILDAQDQPSRFEVHEKKGAYLLVRGVDWPEFKVVLKLTRQHEKWLIDGSGMVNIPLDQQISRDPI